MQKTREQPSITITRGHEQPPLEYGPQRLHYIYSVGIPQAYLTLFSILQGVVFSILFTTIPLPQVTTLSGLSSLATHQYFYLPYIISFGMLILIWLHQVSITLTGGWPHSFSQIGLVTLLTLFEVFAVRVITTLPLWLFFTGCISLIGGITLIRTGTMHLLEDFDTSAPFQKFGHSLKQSEIRRGKQYILIGISLIILAIGYGNFISLVKVLAPSLINLVPWSIYLIIGVLLSIIILTRRHSKQHKEARSAMYASTDIYVKNGVARYRKNKHNVENTALHLTHVPKEISNDHFTTRNPASAHHSLKYIIGSIGIISTLILQLFFFKKFSKRV